MNVLERLINIRNSLQFCNDSPGGGISDTLWMMHQPETIFDAIDSLIEHLQKPQTKDLTEDSVNDAFIKCQSSIIKKLRAEIKRLEDDGVIRQRDLYHSTADDLASEIGNYLKVDIGEHTSANNPWLNALYYLREAQKKPYLTYQRQTDGKLLAITLCDDEHRILEVLWKAPDESGQQKIIDKKIESQIMSEIGRYFDESSIYPMELYSRIMAILRGDT